MAVPVTNVGYRDGGKTSEAGIHRITRGLYTREGIILSGDLQVTQNGTPDTNVLIATGDVVVGSTSPYTTFPPYFYHAWVATSGLVAIAANASGSARVDCIVAYIDLSVVSSASNDNPGALKFADVQGTPAGSPVAPSDATIQAQVGGSNPWVLLATVAVANGFSTIVTANITDCRPFADTPSTLDNDQTKPSVATGLVWSATSGLSSANSAGRAYCGLSGGGGRSMYKPAVTHLFTANKDTYIDLPNTAKATLNDDFTYQLVNNGAAAPALATGSIRLAKVVTNGTNVTSVVTSGQDSLGNSYMPKPVGTNQLEQQAVLIGNLSTNLQNAYNFGWAAGLLPAVSSVAAQGNRSYNITFASSVAALISNGQRLRTTRTVAAPTQCTSLNGTTQFYSKTTPAGMTATNFLVQGWWIKLASYNGAIQTIASRYNGTSGFTFAVNAAGQLVHTGFNAAAANFNSVTSNQSVPLNKWVHVAVEHDMSTATLDGTHSWIMIDGVDVPAFKSTGGTNPTALVQAGNLEIGSQNGGLLPFNGKIANGGIFGAAVTEATIRGYMSQGLVGTETSLISAYSFNNSINDLNANANNLTANGSAVATNADSPFGGQADGTISATLDYGIVTKVATTVATVQLPEGCTIPTSGGVTSVDISAWKVPYQFPAQRGKWRVACYVTSSLGNATVTASGVWTATILNNLTIPIGEWRYGYQGSLQFGASTTRIISGFFTLASSAPATGIYTHELVTRIFNGAASSNVILATAREASLSLSAATSYILYAATDDGVATITYLIRGDQGPVELYAECAYL